ncbi:MAG: DEAD/DEAH box helicase [Synergistaceae bacterium]|nr:DEAD/DEAH box helicase [Synergistaceae bacterium]
MLVLHGAFSGGFSLWGECSFTRAGLQNLRRIRHIGDELVVDHSWDPGAEKLVQVLDDLGFKCRHGAPGNRLDVLLPTFAEKYPLPSTALLGEIPRPHVKEPYECSMRRWRVDCVPLDMEDLTALMPLLSGAGEPSSDGRLLAPGVMIGLDLCYVMECWRFVQSLLERGRFLPDIRVSRAGGEPRYESIWRPLLAGDDAERFSRLARLMPRVLSLMASDVREPDSAVEAEVLSEMLVYILDGFVRFSWNKKRRNHAEDDDRYHKKLADVLVKPSRLHETASQAERRKRGRLVSALNPHLLWVRSLGWMCDADDLSSSLESIYSDVRDWWSSFEWFAHAQFKLCVKLVEDSGAWRLEYLLKYPHTGALAPVRDVWSGLACSCGGESGDYMRRCVLLILGRIGTIMGPVMRSLELYAPSGCDLDVDEAAEFLLSHIPVLESNGVGVYFPDWWDRASSERLTLRGRVTEGNVPRDFFRDMLSSANGSGDPVLSLKWEIALGGSLLSDCEAELIMSRRTPLMCIRERWVFVTPEQVELLRRRMEQLPACLTATEALCLAASNRYVDGFMDSPELEKAYESLSKGITRELLEKPPMMRGHLRPYQSRGFSWLSFLSSLGLGACLADDMGLGKTIQTLALIQYRRDMGERRPVLLICPTSVLENWRMEISRFLPGLPIYMHHGRSRARGAEFIAVARGSAMVLSSYAVLQRDVAACQETEWSGIVLDEAQNIKNPDTNQAKAARCLNSDWRIALTGTPVENHVGDLWSIMEFLMPGLLGNKRRFNDEYVRPIQESRDTSLMNSLKRTVAPFIMRRMKTDKDIVPDLPSKIETKVFCGLKREQVSLYSDVTDELSREIAGVTGIKRRGIVLAGLTRIKQICDHPSLLSKDGDFSPERSAKLERMLALAEEMFETGDRTLIFTQYVEMGNILKSQLQDRFGKEVLFLHGSIFKDARDRMVRRFQEGSGPQFFVLSLKAGGVGLNLTGANHVVMYDRWWNPAVEQQAIDRAYRIGQSRNVQVHIFCCRGTLEERIDELISSKKEVANMVVESSDNWITELSDRELQRLLSLSPGVLES